MDNNKFKNASRKVVLESRVDKFISSNIDEEIAVKRIEKFFRIYLLCVSVDFDQYVLGKRKRSRQILVTAMKVILFVVGTRFALSGLTRSVLVRAIACDSNYLIGHPMLISVMMSICAFVILFIGITLQYQESQSSLWVFKFLYLVKHKRLSKRLDIIHYRRLILFSSLLTKYLLNQAFWPLVVVTNGFMATASVIAYLDPTTGFTAIGLIVWIPLTFIWTVQFYGYVSVGFVIWFMSALTLKYQFEEINKKIGLSLKLQSHKLFARTVKEHQDSTMMAAELNGFYKYMLFILYYCATPALLILIYLTHEPNTYFYARFAAAFIFCMVFGGVFDMNLMSTWINKAAILSKPDMYAMISKVNSVNNVGNNNININNKLKQLMFLEKLTSKELGYYCLDMFPMNNLEFFEYLSVTGKNYFLIIDLVNQFINQL